MAGFFGSISKSPCITDVFYGTDYHSHLGTRRAGIATYDASTGNFRRVIHSISSATFRVKMEPELPKFLGNAGIGIISDTDAQPLLFNSHLGRFALSTVGKIGNLDELAAEALKHNMHLSEFSSGRVNPTELVGLMIIQKPTLAEGIRYVQQKIKGSLSLILLTEDGIVCARPVGTYACHHRTERGCLLRGQRVVFVPQSGLHPRARSRSGRGGATPR